MHLRKVRTHQTGASNLANRPEGIRPMTTAPGQTRISFLSTAKGNHGNHVDEVIEARLHRTATTPFERTRSFYGEHSKPEHVKTKIGSPRKLLLEDPDKMKMPFTGDTFLIYDKNLEKYRGYNSPQLLGKEALDKEQLAKEKHEAHAKAIQETQLVGYDKYNLDTLKNNVNLEKVREAKRVIRRKYANRKNMQKIFAAWDADRTGYISLENLYQMTKILGLNLNYDESRVLLASADRKGTGTLGLDEFFDLIHNKDDALNVDLENLSKYIDSNYLLQKEKLESGDDNVIKKLGENAKKAREIKHMNQVNVILKNKLNDIVHNFNQSDPYRNGYTTFDAFEQNLLRLGIDEKLISRNDIKNLYDKYKLADHTINYRNFIEGLKSFNFLQEEVYKEYENPNPRPKTTTNAISLARHDDNNIAVVDIRTLPYSTVYTFLGKKRKLSRLVQKFFPRKEDLKNYIAQTLNIPKEETESHYMTKDETKDMIVNLFKKFDVSSLTQRDFEGFLSTLIYNKQNCTKADEILKNIYDEDEDALINKINTRKKGPPPHKLYSQIPEAGMEESKAISIYTDGNYMTQDEKQKKVNQLLETIDKRIFIGKKKFYELYKMFDVDKDGFVSRKDFVQKAEEMALVPKEDLPILVDYLDSDNKGYVDFSEFHKKIRSNATRQDENFNPLVFPSVVPSKANFDKVANQVPDIRKKLDEIASVYKPENYPTARPTSRFGQAPAWKNTFLNIQAPMTSPMFISERERFIKTPEAKVFPTFEEKEKKMRIQSAKLETIRHHQENVQKKAQQDMLRQDNLEQSRLRTRALAVSAHEQGAKLRNNYML